MIFSKFIEPGAISEDGGKGYNLKILTQKGLNIPEGIILRASFYRTYYPKPPEFNFNDNEQLERQCVHMRQLVIQREIPAELKEELNKFLSEFEPSVRFAVRSSSTFEDLDSAAFAGQHDTFLNITQDKIEEKIKECLSSLWQKHAVLYRNYQGFNQQDASMAVVIQRMIQGTCAGVAFSVDPVSGNLSNVLIEANFGIGESVVGGEAITDSWIVNSENWDIVERRVKEKEYALIASEIGIERKEITGDDRAKPCLADSQIIEVAKQARKLMDLYGNPQDIEWVYESEQLYLVQARPQTTIPPKFTRDESAERFPDPLTPLTWSYVKEAFNNSLEYSLDLMNIKLPTRPWFNLKNYYVYGNQNAVNLLALYKPIEAETFEELIDEIPILRIKYQWIKDLPQIWMRDLDSYLIRIGRLSNQDFNSYSNEDFQDYFKRLFSLADDYFKPNIAISMTQSFLTKTLFGIIKLLTKDEMEALDIFKKIISVSETKTGQINHELFKLSLMVKEHPELQEILSRKEAVEKAEAHIKSLEQFPEFNKQFSEFIENYGHREISFDYYNPTWKEAPHVVLDLIYLLSTTEQLIDPKEKEREAKSAQLFATQKLYSQTPKELHSFMHELIRLTLNFTFLDDLEHFQTTRINLLARQAVGSYGIRIKENCNLDDPYDIFFLIKDEFEKIASFRIPDNLLKIISHRKSEFLQAKQNEPLWDLDLNDGCSIFSEGTEEEGILKGIPGSPGECEGNVYLVHGVEDFSGMSEGSILVAKTTNPAWTPLFYKAKGVITESGGPLSHGAVTARELGLPAVMSVRNCLKILKPDDKVYLNGQKGLVRYKI